ncbi:hypothetical protein RFI_03563 [Reticulomyxa filosa]|uniref:Uncharacterized protein n=1 Tax=Reticulomyxa filosa TaxID=46433 RepID=X6P4S3_RETFI|nr:hypothetical protein RFI_03563 [Reticulomyxa filosa]|eukprot:ETO33540.1 hypothetical protein RFI_03563 [Reticulomyxa filosa]
MINFSKSINEDLCKILFYLSVSVMGNRCCHCINSTQEKKADIGGYYFTDPWDFPLSTYQSIPLQRVDFELSPNKGEKSKRCYLIFDPQFHVEESKKRAYSACVFFFHGTNETCYDTDLIQATDDNSEPYAWYDLSLQKNVLLVICQSKFARHSECEIDTNTKDVEAKELEAKELESHLTTMKTRAHLYEVREKDGYKCVWLPGEEDIAYVKEVKSQIQSKYVVGDSQSVDTNNNLHLFYALGYSNGGMFVCELCLRHRSQPLFGVYVTTNSTVHYCGEYQLYYLHWLFDGSDDNKNNNNDDNSGNNDDDNKDAKKTNINSNTKFVLITGTADENRSPTYRALALCIRLQLKHLDVRFEDLKNRKHYYSADMTKHIWDCCQHFEEFRDIPETDLFTYK